MSEEPKPSRLRMDIAKRKLAKINRRYERMRAELLRQDKIPAHKAHEGR